RKTIRLAHRRRADNLDGQAEVRDHVPNDRELLKILLAKYREIRLHDVEELGDYRAHAVEVTGTEFAVEQPRELRHHDSRAAAGAFRVHLGDVRHEHEIAARRGEHSLVLLRRPRIVREIFVRSELHRIHEDAGDEAIAPLARELDETDVPRMQVTHGGHERHALPLTMPALDARADGGNGRDGVHVAFA